MRTLYRELVDRYSSEITRQALATLAVLSAGQGIDIRDLVRGNFDARRLSRFAQGDRVPCGFHEQDEQRLREALGKQQLPVRTLAEAWTFFNRWRLEIVQPVLAPGILAFCVDLLTHPDVRAASVHVRAGPERLRRLPRWPLRVISPGGASGRRLSELLAHLPDVASVLERRQKEGDLLIVPANVSMVPGSGGTPVGGLPRASLAIAIQPEETETEDAMVFALCLRFALDADAVVVVRASEKQRNAFLHRLLLELIQGRPFDLAVATSGLQELAAPPLFLSSQRFLQEAHLETLSVSNIDIVEVMAELLNDSRKYSGPVAIPAGLSKWLGIDARWLDGPTLASDVVIRFIYEGFNSSPSEFLGWLLELRHLLNQQARDASAPPLAGIKPRANLLDSLGTPTGPGAARASRHLHANIFAGPSGSDAHPVFGPLDAGRAYRVEVHIGPRLRSGQALRKRFPAEKLPRQKAAHTLMVVFADISGGEPLPEPQVTSLVLPKKGASSRAVFNFTPRLEGRFAARIAILHDNRVLQTMNLRAPVGSEQPESSRLDGVRLEPELAPAWTLEELETRSSFDATLVLNHDEAGTPRAMAVADGEVRWVSLNGLEKALQGIRGQIDQVTDKEQCPTGLEDPAMVRLLRVLAKQGSDLWMEVMDQEGVPEPLRKGTRIQVIEAREGTFLPVELFYDRESPTDDATICPHARQALQEGQCPGVCPQGRSAERVVCPLGFWGMTRVIERQRRGTASPALGDVGLQLSPTQQQNQIALTPGALFGYSRKVDKGDPGSSAKVLSALKESFPESDTADGWAAWEQKVQSLGPSLLVLLVHTDKDSESGLPVIEIANEYLRRAKLKASHVRSDKVPATIVLFLGCDTAMPPAQYQSFVGRFRQLGAAVVLSTIASIRGRHACPTAANVIRHLSEATEGVPRSWGDVFVRIKRELLAKGDALVLCFAAYGDVDWQLVHPREVRT
ncbi:hypothetical protein [Corallococcus sp. CA041A]|uniref:hypothetical protein n=1 Tax=Corallococcus TaxID=83461 RepID=UPI0011C34CB0|nr:hypothetical protein [Corallococcus sp. CA041A]